MSEGRPSRRAARKERRSLRRNAPYVGVDDLFGAAACEDDVRVKWGRSRGLAGLIAGIVGMAMVAASVVAPFLLAAAGTVQAAHEFYEALPSDLPDQPLPTRSVILAADGTKIAQFFSENRVPVTLAEVPQVMRQAIIDIEDSRFYEHGGIDFRGTARALVNNLRGGATQGGSTITQQYVKNVLFNAADDDQAKAAVTSRTSYMRKLREAKLALELEQSTSKAKILEGYLNIAYFGNGAYGIGTAARLYFSKNVSDLNLREAALLAGLVRNPTGYDPTAHPGIAKQRRDVVLARMRELGHVTAREYKRAHGGPLGLRPSTTPNGCLASRYPFWCQWIKQQLEDDPVFGRTEAQRNERLYRGGMIIRTSLDPAAQDAAQKAVDAFLGRRNRVAASVVTVEPGTGRVVAMAVNRTFGTPTPAQRKSGDLSRTEIILPITPAFQPGSNFKPFTLAAALERGFDPRTRFYAPPTYAPAGLASPPGGFENSGSAEAGDFDAATALARSSNTWFVRLEEQVGVLNVASMAERLGITSLPRTGPRAITYRDAALTLGAYEVSPVEMAGAYATFAAHGVHCVPAPIDSITGPDGEEVAVPDPDCHQAIPASVADTVAQIMTGVIDGSDPYRTGEGLSLGRPAAGKTGTTQNQAAVWFSGYTPQFATSVAVMDPRGGFAHPLIGFYAGGRYIDKAYGGLVAGPIWRQVMLALHRGLPVEKFAKPDALVTLSDVVPDVRGLTIDAAYRALRAAGYQVRLAKENADADEALPADVIAAQNPAAGTVAPLDSTIYLTLSAGSDRLIALPDQD